MAHLNVESHFTSLLHCFQKDNKNLCVFLMLDRTCVHTDFHKCGWIHLCQRKLLTWNHCNAAGFFDVSWVLLKTKKHFSSEWEIVNKTTLGDWDGVGRVITQTCGRAFQTLGRAFSFLLNTQKLGWAFQRLAACFETNARPSLLINGHIKRLW